MKSVKAKKLVSWTSYSKEAEAYSGTARYTLKFDKPKTKVNTDSWLLKLGDVRESAIVTLNGKYIGCVWANPFEIDLGDLKPGKNKLEIEVTNLSANRIRDMEKSGKEWKIFHNVNMVNMKYQKFDATKWDPMPSGLLGPVKLQAVFYD